MATTTVTNIVRDFKDLDLNFTIHPVRKDINKNVGEIAVINSIKNLVLTNHYEKPFNSGFGSNLRRLLFENTNSITASLIEREISQVILNYEPRARVRSVFVNPNTEETGFNVRLEFFIINRTEPVSINFFLERIR
jgi:phage baseplate assembly protein W